MKKFWRSKNTAHLPLCEFSHFPTCDNCLKICIWQTNALYAQGSHFSRLLAAEVCASAVVMLDTPCSEVVWRVLATHCIRQFPFHFPSRASSCAITFQTESTYIFDTLWLSINTLAHFGCSLSLWKSFNFLTRFGTSVVYHLQVKHMSSCHKLQSLQTTVNWMNFSQYKPLKLQCLPQTIVNAIR
jgi:hypothetical protein